MLRLLGRRTIGITNSHRQQASSSPIATLTRGFSSKAGDEKKAPPKGTPYSKLTVGIPKERFPLEKRVAATPESVQRLVKPGFNVAIEKGAGEPSFFSDADYEAAGAKIVSTDDVWKQSDIVLKLRPPSTEELSKLENRTIISFLYPKQNEGLMKQLQDQKATAFAMDCIPRTLSRGQTYDALSSQANISGYRAVLEASHEFGRFFAGQMTAAGKVPPAKVCKYTILRDIEKNYVYFVLHVDGDFVLLTQRLPAIITFFFYWTQWSLELESLVWPPFKLPRIWELL
jgi:hypothetical protein